MVKTGLHLIPSEALCSISIKGLMQWLHQPHVCYIPGFSPTPHLLEPVEKE